MQKILITGANGFVGSYLISSLLQKHREVVATGRGPSRLPFSGPLFTYQVLDFTSREAIDKVFEEFRPGIVIHAGALSRPDECEQNREGAFLTNVTGTIYLLEASRRYKSDFVFLSTDFVFSGDKGMYREEDERAPVNYYGQTKLLAEDQVMNYPWRWSIARTVLVYGKPLQSRENIVSNTAAALREGKRLRIFDDQLRTPTYVGDLANGIAAIIEKNAGGIYHLSGKDVLTPYQVATATARYLGLDPSLVERITEKDMQQPAKRPKKTGFDISKARRVLGFEPVSFEQGLARTFE